MDFFSISSHNISMSMHIISNITVML